MKLLKKIFGAKSERSPDAAAQVARVLFDGWVQKDQGLAITRAELSEALWPRFQSKWRLYREATVLMVLLSKEQRDARYSELIKEYERLIYPSANPTPEGLTKASDLRAAMRDIAELIEHGKGKEFTWSTKWFEQIGELPHNPVTCLMLTTSCMDLWIAVAESLDKMAAEGIVP